MLYKYLYLLASIFLASFSGTAWAAWSTGSWKVANISIEGSESSPVTYVSLIGNAWPNDNCQDKGYVYLDTSNERGKQALSALLTAATANKKIRVYFPDEPCFGSRYKITMVNVEFN